MVKQKAKSKKKPEPEKPRDELQRAREQAQAQLDSIREMVFHLKHTEECEDSDCDLSDEEIFGGLNIYYKKGDPTHGGKATEAQREEYHDRDAASQRISEDPLSVEIRSDWHTPGSESEAGQYTILLCYGGPACRIIGDLSQYHEPESARLEYQDWFTPWTEYRLDSDEEAVLVSYAQQFYFGE